MAVAEGHLPEILSSLSSSSSPDYPANSRFTPPESSNNSNGSGSSSRNREHEDEHHGGDGENEAASPRSRRPAGMVVAGRDRVGGRGMLMSDGIEAYELRDIVAGRGRGGSLTDDSDEDKAMMSDSEEEEEEDLEEQPAVREDHRSLAYTAEEERAVVRKFDRRLVLFVALLYMLSFLDRSNIGNAYTAGMDEDLLQTTDPLGIKHGDSSSSDYYYEWALTAFYLAYIAFEWLSLLWTVIPAHIYVSGIVFSWGIVASLQSVAGSYYGLICLRFLLGIGEAGFTGIPIYLSFFFRRDELALRTAVFISAAPLAMTFASSLAWVITKVGENGSIAPWRLLFLLEGFPAVIVATLAWSMIPDSPERASYLTKREKRIARQRLLSRVAVVQGKKKTRSRQSDDDDDDDDDDEYDDMDSDCTSRCCQSLFAILLDPVPWATAAIFFLTNVAYSSLPVFLPSILTQMGHSALAAQALSAPPYLVSFVVVLAVAAVSDALQSRSHLIAASALVSTLGYAFLAFSESMAGGGNEKSGMMDMARYLAIYPATAGFFSVVVLTISLNVNNARGDGHKGGGFALMQVVGQCGPLVGTRLFDPKTDGPWFTRGMSICAGCMLGVAGLAMALRWHLARENRRMDADEDVGAGDSDEEEGLVGGTSSDGGFRKSDRGGFRYML